MGISRDSILRYLSQYHMPDSDTDIIQAGLVCALSVKDDLVHFVLEDRQNTGVDLEHLRELLSDGLSGLEGVKGTRIYLSDPMIPNLQAPDLQTPGMNDAPKKLKGVKHVIVVASGKGGVGKSTVSAHLALTLAGQGKKVGLLDADIYGPSQHRIMGATGRPISYDGTLIPLAAHGLKFMSLGSLTEPSQALVWRGPILHDTLTRLLRGVRWAPLDVLVIDLPPGTGDVPLTLLQQVEVSGAVLVSTPQELSRMDLRRSIDLFQRSETPILGLIENMAYHVCKNCGTHDHVFGEGLRKFARETGIPFLGDLPLTSDIADSTEAGEPRSNVKSPDADPFTLIANQIWDKLGETETATVEAT